MLKRRVEENQLHNKEFEEDRKYNNFRIVKADNDAHEVFCVKYQYRFI
jgi:hypothetical protein